jgi:hypothetical protein
MTLVYAGSYFLTCYAFMESRLRTIVRDQEERFENAEINYQPGGN